MVYSQEVIPADHDLFTGNNVVVSDDGTWVYQDKIVKTKDGKTLILKGDGSWYYKSDLLFDTISDYSCNKLTKWEYDSVRNTSYIGTKDRVTLCDSLSSPCLFLSLSKNIESDSITFLINFNSTDDFSYRDISENDQVNLKLTDGTVIKKYSKSKYLIVISFHKDDMFFIKKQFKSIALIGNNYYIKNNLSEKESTYLLEAIKCMIDK